MKGLEQSSPPCDQERLGQLRGPGEDFEEFPVVMGSPWGV